MQRFIVCIVLVGCLSVLWVAPMVHAETITMAFQQNPAEDFSHKFVELVYTEAFRRLGIEFAYKVYPVKRCSVLANAGEVDGEPAKLAGLTETYPNVIQVAEPILSMKTAAFATNAALHLDGWESLQGTTYRVEYLTGIVVSERNLQRVVKPELLSTVPTIPQALKKLIASRTDVFVHGQGLVMSVLQTPEFKDSGIINVGVMEEQNMYPYLHNKHAALARQLAEVLKQMKTEGVFAEYQAQAAQFFQPKSK